MLEQFDLVKGTRPKALAHEEGLAAVDLTEESRSPLRTAYEKVLSGLERVLSDERQGALRSHQPLAPPDLARILA